MSHKVSCHLRSWYFWQVLLIFNWLFLTWTINRADFVLLRISLSLLDKIFIRFLLSERRIDISVFRINPLSIIRSESGVNRGNIRIFVVLKRFQIYISRQIIWFGHLLCHLCQFLALLFSILNFQVSKFWHIRQCLNFFRLSLNLGIVL